MDPGPIIRLVTSYWESQCLFTANRLGIFEVLSNGPMSAETVADTLGVAPRQMKLLLKACVGLGLLEEDTGSFRNHPRSQTFLVPGQHGYLGNALRYGDDMWAAWGQLGDVVRSGTPAIDSESYTGDDPEKTRNFVYGMHDRAVGIGRALVGLVDLSGRTQLLDIGGGPGTYAALFAQRNPDLRATVLDLPEVVALASEILHSMGASEQVRTLSGDYKSTALPASNDVVLVSGVFHRESPETCRELILRARGALDPDGLLVVADVFTDEGGATPAFAALFGLNMMLSAREGGVHADSDVAAWMVEAGFRHVNVLAFPPPMPHRVVTGIR